MLDVGSGAIDLLADGSLVALDRLLAGLLLSFLGAASDVLGSRVGEVAYRLGSVGCSLAMRKI